MMRKFPKLLAVVLAIAIIICPAMCLTSMAETPANDYTVSYANDVVTVKVDAANGFLVALLRLDVEGFDVNEAGIAVTTTEGVEFGANPDFDADAGVLSLLLAAKDAANINVVTSATVTIPVTKTATDDNYGIKLTTIQAADAGSVVDGVLVAEDFIDFPYVADAEDGTIVDAPEEKVEAIKPCTHENTTENTTASTCTVPGSVTVTCDDCGATISSEPLPLAEHVAGQYEFDENYHWNVCTYGCSEKLNNAEHDFTNGDCVCGAKAPVTECQHENMSAWEITQPTKDATGLKTRTCLDCSEHTEEVVIPVPMKDDTFTFKGSVAVQDSLGIGYSIKKANITNPKYVSIEFVSAAEKYNNVRNVITAPECTLPRTDSATYYIGTYSGIAMYELDLSVSTYIKYYDADGIFVAYTSPVTDSPFVLLKNKFASSSDASKKLTSDMFNLGAAAQVYFSEDFPDSDLAKATPINSDPTYLTHATTGEITGLNVVNNIAWDDNSPITKPADPSKYLRASLNYAGTPTLGFVLSKPVEHLAADYELTITYDAVLPSKFAGERQMVIGTNGDAAWTVLSSNKYMNCIFDQMTLADSNQVITAVLKYQGKTVCTQTVTIDAVVNDKLSGTGSSLALTQAFARFSAAARANFS